MATLQVEQPESIQFKGKVKAFYRRISLAHNALATACVLVQLPSFRIADAICLSIVLTARFITEAVSAADLPFAAQSRTSRSRLESRPEALLSVFNILCIRVPANTVTRCRKAKACLLASTCSPPIETAP